jgi:hypothetical protein
MWPSLLKIENSSNDQNCSILAYTVQIWAFSGLKQSSFGHLKNFLFLVMVATLDTGRR